MKRPLLLVLALAVAASSGGCISVNSSDHDNDRTGSTLDLVGAWRGKVQFTTGAYASIQNLDFLYCFNAGGTMTESSNYDAMPPVTPAYGVWKKTGERTYEARYVYYWTKPPAKLEELTTGGGWSPGGHGVLVQQITLSPDGNSFDSTIAYEVFDTEGKHTDPTSQATAQATRIRLRP